MDTMYAKVLRDTDLEKNFVGERLSRRQFGYASDTAALVIRDADGLYHFIRNYDDADVRRLIDGVKGGIHYGVCLTADNLPEKTVEVADFVKRVGASVIVWFAGASNTASDPTLNVGGTGASPIQYRNAAPGKDRLMSGMKYLFVFDGTFWSLMNTFDRGWGNIPLGGCQTAADVSEKECSINGGFERYHGSLIGLYFTHGNTAADARP